MAEEQPEGYNYLDYAWIYSSRRWRRIRKFHLDHSPECVYCKEKGLDGVEATVVDHIIPHRGDMNLVWDKGNLQSLCVSCHSGEKARKEHGVRERDRKPKKPLYDERGFPVWWQEDEAENGN